MSYALATIWHERSRFLPAVLAIAFSAMLIAVQTGLLVGLLSMMSTPVDKATADIWLGYPGVRSVDLGFGIPEEWMTRLQAQPEVVQVEPIVLGFAQWAVPVTEQKPETSTEVIMIIGTSLDRNSIAALEPLRRETQLLAALAEPFTILIDESECDRLGVSKIGDIGVVMGKSVRIVGFVKGLRSLGGAYAFCSIDTARLVLGYPPYVANYVVGRCRDPKDAATVVQRLKGDRQMAVYTRDEFSVRSRIHWMTTTKSGLALAFTAILGLVVGAVVTSQTLYAATAAAQREFATLRAMGIPRWRMQMSVMTQSFWVGLGGIIAATPITLILAEVGRMIGTEVRLPFIIVAPTIGITMGMALMSGLLALRSLQRTDPVHNIR